MSIRTVPGEFPIPSIFPSVGGTHVLMIDQPSISPPLVTDWTTGGVRVAPLPTPPSLQQTWTILGFAATIYMGVILPPVTANTNTWAKFGRLWLGLFTEGGDPGNKGGGLGAGSATFPQDLSTLVKAWDGATDEIRQCPNTFVDLSQTTIVVTSVIFPSPVTIRPGSELEMGMVLTPSLISVTPPNRKIQLVVHACRYTLIYEDHKSGG